MSIDELIPCPICDAKGELPGPDGFEVCPVCMGEMRCTLGAALDGLVTGQRQLIAAVNGCLQYIAEERKRKP